MKGKTAPRLGKGLSALLGDGAGAPAAAAPGTPATPTALPIEALAPGPFQPRGPIDAAGLEELAASIRRNGVLQPLLVRADPARAERYQIIAGERRWRASQMAGLLEVPAVVRGLSDAEAMAAALIENLQREDLNAIEEARGYRRLVEEFGLTHQALAESLGKSRAHLSNTLRLLGLPGSVQDDLVAGRLTAGHGRALLAAPDPRRLAEEVKARGLSVRQTEARAASEAAGPAASAASRLGTGYAHDPEVRTLAADLTERLGLGVRIEGEKGRGRVVLEFRSLDQLDALIALLHGPSGG